MGGRIVSATRHARRFCVLARSCAACALNKGYACACARPRFIRVYATRSRARLIRRKAPRAGPELSRPYVNRSGPSAWGPSPCAKKERGGGRERRAASTSCCPGIKSSAATATATAAINTHLFRCVLCARARARARGVGACARAVAHVRRDKAAFTSRRLWRNVNLARKFPALYDSSSFVSPYIRFIFRILCRV